MRSRAAACPRDTLTVIVPRHPQRFDEVAALLRSARLRLRPPLRERAGAAETFRWYSATRWASCPRTTPRPTWRSSAAACCRSGGQNLIEAIAAGTPTLVGPHTFNFAEATSQAIAAQAALRVGDADALVAEIGDLLRDPARRARMRDAALAFHAAHRRRDRPPVGVARRRRLSRSAGG